MDTSDKIQLFLLIATVIGLIISILFNSYQNRNLTKQLKLNFFADYTKRYQEIIVNLPEEIYSKEFDFKDLSNKQRAKTMRLIRAYFDLCSEEFYLNKNNHIDCYIWKQWSNGIDSTMKKVAFCKAWKIINKDTYYYDDFKEFMNCFKK